MTRLKYILPILALALRGPGDSLQQRNRGSRTTTGPGRRRAGRASRRRARGFGGAATGSGPARAGGPGRGSARRSRRARTHNPVHRARLQDGAGL